MSYKMKCFTALVKREIFLFFKEFVGKFIDVSIILLTNVIVFGYFLSQEGLKDNFGELILVGAIAGFGLFEVVTRATILAQEISERKISNYLVLPLSSSYYFISIAVSWAICTSLLTLPLYPLGKLILLHRFDLSQFSFVKFSLIFFTANLFYGFFALWLASLVMSLRNSTWLWCRVINPLFMFCGFYYSWRSAMALSTWVGYLHLMNPLLYVLEGTKAAVLGQKDFLPFWICILVLWASIAFFAFAALRRLKRRLDCV